MTIQNIPGLDCQSAEFVEEWRRRRTLHDLDTKSVELFIKVLAKKKFPNNDFRRDAYKVELKKERGKMLKVRRLHVLVDII